MKVLSWNIWVDGYQDQIRDYLKKSNADVIALQEVIVNDSSRNIIGFLENLGYEHAYIPVWNQKGEVWSGSAIFSKFELDNVQKHELSKTEMRGAVSADLKINNKILHVFSTHLIHTHQKQMGIQGEQVKKLISLLPKQHTIVMGDFNSTPDSSVIKIMQKIMTDTDPSSQPTWSVYPEGCETCKPQKIDMRLDYIFVSKDIKVRAFEVGKSRGSDHLPILAEIDT